VINVNGVPFLLAGNLNPHILDLIPVKRGSKRSYYELHPERMPGKAPERAEGPVSRWALALIEGELARPKTRG
jgi:hypothetical protein